MIKRAGIIAAGEGSRLSALHPGLPKPLVPVSGTPLSHWVVRSLLEAGIEDFTLLHNSRGRGIETSLRQAFPNARWTFLERDTASSWESFRLVAGTLADKGDFMMSTADALVAPKDVSRFLSEAAGWDAALAFTDFIDDEKPLLGNLGPTGLVTAIGPDSKDARHATCGLYYLSSTLAERLPEPARFNKLRDYWTDLVRQGAKIKGVPLPKTLDVDRPEDIRQAELFVKETAWSAPR